MDKTLENIKLISEFQGIDYSDVIGMCKSEAYDAGYRDDVIIDNPAYWSCYHNSWNWLMPVVEEIEQNKKYFKKELQLNITKYSVCWQTIDNEAVILNSNVFHKYGTYAGVEKIQAVYKSVIDFIKWYNQQNKS